MEEVDNNDMNNKTFQCENNIQQHEQHQQQNDDDILSQKKNNQDQQCQQRQLRRQQRQRPEMYLIITNISKHTNVKSLLTLAVAYQCKEVLVVGQKNFNFTIPLSLSLEDDNNNNNNNENKLKSDVPNSIHTVIANGSMPIHKFDKWDDCIIYLHTRTINVCIVGVEIHDQSILIDDYLKNQNTAQQQDTAFIFGNEGTGMNIKHINSCHEFVRISQYGTGTASLNVAAAASIILYRYYNWQRQIQLQQQQQIQKDEEEEH